VSLVAPVLAGHAGVATYDRQATARERKGRYQ
jgi:hypothetical protein